MTNADMPKVHEGRNVKRFREMLGVKRPLQLAKILNVPAEAIRNFDEEQAIHNIQNNYDSAVVNAGPTINYKCTFNPLDKWAEEITENRRLYNGYCRLKRKK